MTDLVDLDRQLAQLTAAENPLMIPSGLQLDDEDAEFTLSDERPNFDGAAPLSLSEIAPRAIDGRSLEDEDGEIGLPGTFSSIRGSVQESASTSAAEEDDWEAVLDRAYA